MDPHSKQVKILFVVPFFQEKTGKEKKILLWDFFGENEKS